MKISHGIFIVFIIVAAVSIAGCSSSGTDSGSGPDSQLSTLEPSHMVLQASDLPAGYVLKEEKQTDTSRMDPSIWSVKKGYEVAFTKGPDAAYTGVIAQSLVIEPADKVGQQISILTGEYAKKGIKPVQLSGPVIGDASSAFTVPGVKQGGEMYMIIFTRKDVVVLLMMSGPDKDYTVLQSVAVKAAEKIP
jgi:hypothetical protein